MIVNHSDSFKDVLAFLATNKAYFNALFHYLEKHPGFGIVDLHDPTLRPGCGALALPVRPRWLRNWPKWGWRMRNPSYRMCARIPYRLRIEQVDVPVEDFSRFPVMVHYGHWITPVDRDQLQHATPDVQRRVEHLVIRYVRGALFDRRQMAPNPNVTHLTVIGTDGFHAPHFRDVGIVYPNLVSLDVRMTLSYAGIRISFERLSPRIRTLSLTALRIFDDDLDDIIGPRTQSQLVCFNARCGQLDANRLGFPVVTNSDDPEDPLLTHDGWPVVPMERYDCIDPTRPDSPVSDDLGDWSS